MKQNSLIQKLLFKKDNNYTFKPVFIIGCGRSGTTILGKLLGNHKDIKYLNERRDLWHKVYPEMDIWSSKIKQPKLLFNSNDEEESKSQYLRNLFLNQQRRSRKLVLLEKLPINNFRLDFIHSVFPDAKFIYLHRNGLEVAKSIAKRVPNGWFGKNDLKLKLLYQYALDYSKLDLTGFDQFTDLEKGIFEWSLSIEQSDKFFKSLDNNKFISLSYQNLIDNSDQVLQNIFKFMELSYSDNFILDLKNQIERKSNKIEEVKNEKILKLGGNLLIETINNTYRENCSNEL